MKTFGALFIAPFLALLGIFSIFSSSAEAGVFELGGAFAYNHNAYAGGSETWMRSYTATFGYYFTADSEVEFSYQDSTNEDFEPLVQDITYRDRVYSINFLYHLAEENATFRPFCRAGLGQLNRDMTGWYQGGYTPGGRLDQVTVIGGLGVKAKIVGRFSLKAEVTSYLSGGNISSWKDNITINIGGSFYF
jgi:hypothetical protein